MNKRKQLKHKKTKKSKGNEKTSKINNSLYPFWYNWIAFPQVQNNNELIEDTTWQEHLQLASKLYKDKSSLPKETILFHGSTVIDPIKNLTLTNRPFFFGLDAFIAIWYISELAGGNISDIDRLLSSLVQGKIKEEQNIEDLKNMTAWEQPELDKLRQKYESNIEIINHKLNNFIESLKLLPQRFDNFDNYTKLINVDEVLSDLKSNQRRYYFLNIYKTMETIPYDYLSESISNQNPADISKCSENACMHPQFGYHVHALEPPVELSMEFTIPANKIGNKLKLIGVYVIDVFKLNENKNKDFTEFKATDAIVLKYNFTKNNTKQLSSKLKPLSKKLTI